MILPWPHSALGGCTKVVKRWNCFVFLDRPERAVNNFNASAGGMNVRR
jgi:hypothetical protein